jgi:hypothetical protein
MKKIKQHTTVEFHCIVSRNSNYEMRIYVKLIIITITAMYYIFLLTKYLKIIEGTSEMEDDHKLWKT